LIFGQALVLMRYSRNNKSEFIFSSNGAFWDFLNRSVNILVFVKA
jgi:hypothetical protein